MFARRGRPIGQLGEGKMTGRGLVDFGRWGKLGEKEKEKGKSWERGPVFGLLLADGGESEVASGEDNSEGLFGL